MWTRTIRHVTSTNAAFDLVIDLSDEDLFANVSAVARELVHITGMDPEDLGHVIGAKRATIYAKLHGSRRFTTAELARLAKYFEVPADTFFKPAGDLRTEMLAAIRSRCLSSVDPAVGQLHLFETGPEGERLAWNDRAELVGVLAS